MRKILFLIPSLRSGGAQRVLVDTVNALDAEKYDITVQAIYPSQDGLQRELAPHIRYRTVLSAHGRLLSRLVGFAVRRLLPPQWVYARRIADGYDVEVAFLEGEATRLLSCPTGGARRLAFVHTDMMDNFGSQGVYRSLAEHRAAYRAYHRIVCVSQQTKRRFVERFGFDTGVTVAYNVCDVARVRRLSLADCPDAPPRGGRRLLVVANLRPEKRLPMLVELLGALRDEGLDFCLDIVGDGPERGAIERAVARADLADRVRLLGHRGNPYPYMRQSELLVIASSAEGYSTVAREARLLGLPVLSTDCGGISELRGDDDGVTVVENHADALKNALRAALTRTDEQVGAGEQIAAGKEKSASCEVQRIEFLLDEQGGEQHVFF